MWQLLIPVLGNVLDKIFPDKTKADDAFYTYPAGGGGGGRPIEKIKGVA